MADPLDEDTGYSYLGVAAAEARAESAKHWAKGGAADLANPVQAMPYWPLPGMPASGEVAQQRHDRRQRR